jgi:prophage tail gpP-like protein
VTEAVSLLVDGRDFKFWSELELTLSLDTFATCTFKAPFEPQNREFRETFRPFTFKPLKVLLDGDTLFTGTMVGIFPEVDAESSSIHVTGYAFPAVLDDCNLPGFEDPPEFKKLTLRDIADQLTASFGIQVDFRGDAGKPFERVKLDAEQTLLDFLVELAQQRSLVFSSTPGGDLLCWKSVPLGSPVAHFQEGEQPLTGIEASFSPQDYFSEITGRGRSRKKKAGKHTEKNPWLPVLRPHNFSVPDADPADVPEATRGKLGRMFASVASWTTDFMPGWRDPQGDLWQPNTTSTVLAPRAMIYRKSELLHRSVKLRQSAADSGDESASLGFVLPGAFTGEIPSFLPWEEPIGSVF